MIVPSNCEIVFPSFLTRHGLTGEKSIDSNLSTMDLPILHSLKGDVYVCKYDLCRAETEYSTALQCVYKT